MQGFTDHDEDIALGGVTCRAGTGLTGIGGDAEARPCGRRFGDCRRARRRHAQRGRSRRRPLRRGGASNCGWSTGASRRCACCSPRARSARCGAKGAAFTAEMRGLSDRLGAGKRPALHRDLLGRSRRCALHDRSDRSGVSRQRHGRGARRATSTFTASGLDSFADGWFTAGKLTFTGGANAGLSVEVKSHRKSGRRHARPVAADAGADRGGRHVHRHGRLRQALRDLPRPLRQRA